jgi:N12 class adenine-specific DNA methylase/SAM-dependent methyltransferase
MARSRSSASPAISTQLSFLDALEASPPLPRPDIQGLHSLSVQAFQNSQITESEAENNIPPLEVMESLLPTLDSGPLPGDTLSSLSPSTSPEPLSHADHPIPIEATGSTPVFHGSPEPLRDDGLPAHAGALPESLLGFNGAGRTGDAGALPRDRGRDAPTDRGLDRSLHESESSGGGLRDAASALDDGRETGRGRDPSRTDPAALGIGYRLTETDTLPTGWKTRARANLNAIQILDGLDRDNRPATPEEQRQLARYTGWGASDLANGMFPDPATGAYRPGWDELGRELERLLPPAAYASARKSTLNAHYTAHTVAIELWKAAQSLGFTGGRVLEPGCGTGNFIGLMPDALTSATAVTGVEIDPTTARIAKALYPKTDIRTEGFEKTRLPEDLFQLAIGNVPFANITLNDPKHNAAGHSIHNHFINKSLALTAPGGLAIVLTSRYTLDAQNPAARRDFADKADLLGAVRLPETAFRVNAGTDAVTDILVLRKRLPGEPPLDAAWTTTTRTPVAATDATAPPHSAVINTYFASNPENVLGSFSLHNGMYGRDSLTVIPDTTSPLVDQIAAAITRIADHARENNRLFTADQQQTGSERPSPLEIAMTAMAPRPIPETTKEGAYFLIDGAIYQNHHGFSKPRTMPIKATAEVAALIGLRDTARRILDHQARDWNGDGEEPWAADQRSLAQQHDDYLAAYGPINRFRLVRHGADAVTGEDRFHRRQPAMGGFRNDPDFGLVRALEHFDDDTQSVRRADIFHTRVLSPTRTIRGVDTAQDALLAVLNLTGHADIDRIAHLAGIDRDAAIAELKGILYKEPLTGQWQTADRYLSGAVRTKLTTAREAAAIDPAYADNVAALERVQPRDLLPTQIDVRLGASWIPATDIEAFANDLLGSTAVSVRFQPLDSSWTVRSASRADSTGVTATREWGTRRMSAPLLIAAALNGRSPEVFDTDSNGSRTKNPDATLAAQEKVQAISDRFATWIWQDTARAERLARLYNDTFNDTVLRHFDGSHLELPGSSGAIALRPHQKNVIWRALQDGNTLAAHVVGAGKTYSACAIAMEERRLGLANKPCIVVPNHMLEQFSREFLHLYPSANILVADKESLDKANRKEFVARCATGTWDAVIITHRGFEAIPVSIATRAAYLNARIDQFREALLVAALEDDTGRSPTVKQLEKAIERYTQRLEKMQADSRKDDGVTFEATGIDRIIVDELHLYKRLAFATKMTGVNGTGSFRAEDLDMKVQHLEERNPGRSLVGLTGTPVTNTLAELYTLSRYFDRQGLHRRGLSNFDSWAALFGRTVTQLELAPDGSSYRISTRFARFANLPELLTQFRGFTDVQTADMLNLPRPTLESGKPHVVVVPASDELKQAIENLVARAEAIKDGRVKPHEDNMLAVTTDGRHLALDTRLRGGAGDPNGGKIGALADKVARIYEQTKDNVYSADDGQPSPRLGALQVVFCDIGTPKANGVFSAYDESRRQLIARGVPDDRIKFVHDYDTDEKKAQLFADCRSGKVSVLFGSTEKMGVGTNIQSRLVHLHELDCPWRPSDTEQRGGRILRQGNQNPTVGVTRYVTEQSFDVYMWQTLERKQGFISQVMTGTLDAREIEDIDAQSLTFAEVKALATGNPIIMEKAGIDADVARLSRLEVAHTDQKWFLRSAIRSHEHAITTDTTLMARIDATIAARQIAATTDFVFTIGLGAHTKRTDAGKALLGVMGRIAAEAQADAAGHRREVIGRFDGFPVSVESGGRVGKGVSVIIDAPCPVSQHIALTNFADASPRGLITKLENGLAALPVQREAAAERIEQARSEIARAIPLLDIPFAQADQLASLRSRQHEIESLLRPVGPDVSVAGFTDPGTPSDIAENVDVLSTPTANANDERKDFTPRERRSHQAGREKLPTFFIRSYNEDHIDAAAFAAELGRAVDDGNRPRAYGLIDALAERGEHHILDLFSAFKKSHSNDTRGRFAAREFVIMAAAAHGLAVGVEPEATNHEAFAAFETAALHDHAAKLLVAGQSVSALHPLALARAMTTDFVRGTISAISQMPDTHSDAVALAANAFLTEGETIVATFAKNYLADRKNQYSNGVRNLLDSGPETLRSVLDTLPADVQAELLERVAERRVQQERIHASAAQRYKVAPEGQGYLDQLRAVIGVTITLAPSPDHADVLATAPLPESLIQADTRVPPVQIELYDSETGNDAVTIDNIPPNDLYARANAVLDRWSQQSPTTGAYDKTWFRITFDDGETYQGRLDLRGPGAANRDTDLSDHVRGFADVTAGLFLPPHMTEDTWRALVSRDPETGESFRRFRDVYALADAEIGRPKGLDHREPSAAERLQQRLVTDQESLTREEMIDILYARVQASISSGISSMPLLINGINTEMLALNRVRLWHADTLSHDSSGPTHAGATTPLSPETIDALATAFNLPRPTSLKSTIPTPPAAPHLDVAWLADLLARRNALDPAVTADALMSAPENAEYNYAATEPLPALDRPETNDLLDIGVLDSVGMHAAWSQHPLPAETIHRLGLLPLDSKTVMPLVRSIYNRGQEIPDAVMPPRGYVLANPASATVLSGASITPSAARPGQFQVTWFDRDGFSGDTSSSTLDGALTEAISRGYTIPAPLLLADAMALPSFAEGNNRLEAASAWNQVYQATGRIEEAEQAQNTILSSYGLLASDVTVGATQDDELHPPIMDVEQVQTPFRIDTVIQALPTQVPLVEADQPPSSKPVEGKVRPFSADDRVVFPDGRHGIVMEVHALTMRELWMGTRPDRTVNDTTYSYTVKTDAGAERRVGQYDNLVLETDTPAAVPADPLFDGKFVEPSHLQSSIVYNRSEAAKALAQADRRRTPSKAAEDRRDASSCNAVADAKERVLASWITENWEHARTTLPNLNVDHQRVYHYLARPMRTAAEDMALEAARRRAVADPSNWKAGDGAGYRVTGNAAGQINRGYRVLSVDPEGRTVILRQIADTGLTMTGGSHDHMPETRVPIGDLVRDRHYDADDRVRTAEDRTSPQRPPTHDAPAMSLHQTKHSQKGHDLFVAKLEARIPDAAYKALLSAAKREGGYYSSYTKEGAIPGFQFRTEDAARRFLSANSASQEEILDSVVETPVDHSADHGMSLPSAQPVTLVPDSQRGITAAAALPFIRPPELSSGVDGTRALADEFIGSLVALDLAPSSAEACAHARKAAAYAKALETVVSAIAAPTLIRILASYRERSSTQDRVTETHEAFMGKLASVYTNPTASAAHIATAVKNSDGATVAQSVADNPERYGEILGGRIINREIRQRALLSAQSLHPLLVNHTEAVIASTAAAAICASTEGALGNSATLAAVLSAHKALENAAPLIPQPPISESWHQPQHTTSISRQLLDHAHACILKSQPHDLSSPVVSTELRLHGLEILERTAQLASLSVASPPPDVATLATRFQTAAELVAECAAAIAAYEATGDISAVNHAVDQHHQALIIRSDIASQLFENGFSADVDQIAAFRSAMDARPYEETDHEADLEMVDD